MSKRSSSTTSTRPHKIQRLMGSTPLRRTESYLSFAATVPTTPPLSLIPYHRTLQYYKEQRDRRRTQFNRSVEPITIRLTTPSTISRPTVRHNPHHPAAQPTTKSIKPKPTRVLLPTVYTPPRQSSPLAPTRASRPGRPLFPRSKPEPDLYRKAIKTCMQASPEGQKILRMGPRLALSIMSATKDLERIVAAQTQQASDSSMDDVIMLDATITTTTTSPVLTKSWVIVPGDDWEMIDCA